MYYWGPTTDLAFWKNSNGHIWYLGNGSTDPLHLVLVYRLFEVGGSNVATSGWTKSKMAAGRHLGKFQMAISLLYSATDHPIDFVFDSRVGYSGMADRMDLLPVAPNPRGGRLPSWKISNDHISGMGYLIHFHELESSLGGVQGKIMSEESLDWSQSKIFLVTPCMQRF